MQDLSKTKQVLIQELVSLRQRIAELEQSESRRKEVRFVYSFLIILTIVVMLFVGGPASGTCNAAGNPREVHVGSELDFPPYALVDKNGQPAGFSVELIKAVTDAMGLSIKISTGSWDTVWNSLVSGQLDVSPIVAKLPERQRLVDFSLPHTETYDAFFVRKGDPAIPNIAAAQGKEIVVMRSDAAHHALIERNFQGKLILIDTIPAGLKLLSSGKHNAVLCSKLIGTLAIKEHGITGLIAGPTIPDYKRVFSFAVKKGETELLEKLNQGLLIVKTSGEYNLIYDKWLSFDDPWRKVQKYILPAIITLIVIVVIAGFWLVTLRRLVRKRTRELNEKNEMLLHAYDNMEVRVQERTKELAQSNQLLQGEITDRKQAEVALRESEKRLQSLTSQLISAQEDERRRISLELHDEMGQTLTAIKFNLTEIENDLPLDSAPTIKENVEEAKSFIDHASDQMHELSHNLRPSILDDLGLVPTVRWHLNRFGQMTDIEAKFEAVDLDERLDQATETALYRIVQESLNNITKHAEAKKVLVRLQRKGDAVAAYIEDDGKGFDMNEISLQKTPETGIGLMGMQQRAHMIGGILTIDSHKGHGTRISIEAPLHGREVKWAK